MSRIRQVFEELKGRDGAALIPYFTGGYPSLGDTAEFVKIAASAGAELVEIGFPFSDPLADGPAIQAASEAALEGKVNSDEIFDLAAILAEEGSPPLVAMTYFNQIYRYGLERFAERAAAGFSAVIVPDLPPEEGEKWQTAASKRDLDVIYLLAPTSSAERIEKVSKAGSGFIYCVSVTGVTGARAALSQTLPDFMDRVRGRTDMPLAVGFGISSPEQAGQVAKIADGVIIGSALVDIISTAPAGKLYEELEDFLRRAHHALQK